MNRDYVPDLVFGGILVAIGGIVTAATYATADPGGTYILFWGPIVYGGYRLVVGVFKWLGSLGR
jgi:hypothetical protein